MKKKVIATLLVGAGLIGTSNVAYASENSNDIKDLKTKVENSVDSVEDGTEEDEMGVASDIMVEQLNYAIEDMREAITVLDEEGIRPDNIDYILDRGSYAIDRVRPIYDELNGDKSTREHLQWISDSWVEINEAVDKYRTAEDGTAEDEMGVASDIMVEQLKYAIEDMREAITVLDEEGIRPDNIDYILSRGSYAIDRIRPIYDELNGDKSTREHLQWINDSWAEINAAVDKYRTAEDGTAEDEMGVASDIMVEQLKYAIEDMREAITVLDEEGIRPDNIDYILSRGSYAIDRIRPIYDELNGDKSTREHLQWINDSWAEINAAVDKYHTAEDGTAEDNMQVEPPVEDGTAADNMGVNPPVEDGTAEDNMQVEPPVGDGTAEDNMQVAPPVEDGSAEDNMQVAPPVEDGTAEDNMQIKPPVEGETAEDNTAVKPTVEDEKTENKQEVEAPVEGAVENNSQEKTATDEESKNELPKTGGAEAVGVLAGVLGALGVAKFSMRKK